MHLNYVLLLFLWVKVDGGNECSYLIKGGICNCIMKRINRLLERQIDKPHSYEELKKEPFPYLEECNRLEIFEFIHQLEIENRQLRNEVTEKHPGKTIEEIVEEDRVRKLTG